MGSISGGGAATAIVLASVLIAARASGSDDGARRHLATAREHLGAARFQEALLELTRTATEATSPALRAEIELERGVVEIALNRDLAALASFSRALHLAPLSRLDPDEVGDDVSRVFECARRLVRGGVETPEPGAAAELGASFRCPDLPVIVAAPAPPLAPPPEPPRTEHHLREVGLAAGGASIVAGSVLGAFAFSARRELDQGIEQGRDVAVLREVEDRGRALALAADLLLGLGVGLGLTAWLLLD